MFNTRGCQNYSKFRCNEERARDLVLNSEVQERLIGASRKFCPLPTRERKEKGSWAALPCPPLHTLPSALPAFELLSRATHRAQQHKDEKPTSKNAEKHWLLDAVIKLLQQTQSIYLSPDFFLWNNVFIDSHYYVFKGVFFFFFFGQLKKHSYLLSNIQMSSCHLLNKQNFLPYSDLHLISKCPLQYRLNLY